MNLIHVDDNEIDN